MNFKKIPSSTLQKGPKRHNICRILPPNRKSWKNDIADGVRPTLRMTWCQWPERVLRSPLINFRISHYVMFRFLMKDITISNCLIYQCLTIWLLRPLVVHKIKYTISISYSYFLWGPSPHWVQRVSNIAHHIQCLSLD